MNKSSTKILLVATTILSACSVKAPNCSDPQTISQVGSQLPNEIFGKNISPPVMPDKISIINPLADKFDDKINKYTCSASATIKNKEIAISYTSQIDDTGKHIVKLHKISPNDKEIATNEIISDEQFKSIIDAMSIKSDQDYNVIPWEDASKIIGIKWDWPYYKSGAHDSSMHGSTKVGNDSNPNIGATEININGARTFITSITIDISNESIDFKKFGPGKFTQLKTKCDSNDLFYRSIFYKFERDGFKPLYILNTGSAGNQISSDTWLIANTPEAALEDADSKVECNTSPNR
jgi:hypothetical protein